MSKLIVKFEQKNLTIPNSTCCATGISSIVSINGLIPGHRYYCQLVSLADGNVLFAQNNFYIVSPVPSMTLPLGFVLENSRSYVIKFKITDLDYRKTYSYWIPDKNEWYKSAYFNGTTNSYSTYATQFNTAPTPATASINGDGNSGGMGNFVNFDKEADWNSLNGNVTTVGTNGSPSYYGTYDQNGNINEWSDDISTKYKPCLGGSWSDGLSNITNIKDLLLTRETDTIGFRVAAAINLDDFIPDENAFVFVSDPGNSADANDLGRVDYNFYIKKYPVTNSEYAVFLNKVASRENKYGLYNSKMTTDVRGGITRTLNLDKTWTYSCKNNMENKPVNFVSWLDAARYCNWLHNTTISGDSTDTENGPYPMDPNNLAPYIGFNYGEDIITIQCGEPSSHKVEFSEDTVKLSEELVCNTSNHIVALIKNAKLGRPYKYEFTTLDSNFATIIPKSGTVIAGSSEQNVNAVYSYSGSIKKTDLKLTVTDLVDNIDISASILLNCEKCIPSPTPTPTQTPNNMSS